MGAPGDGGAAAAPAWVAFDLETTGLSPRADRIIEVGAVRFGADGVAATLEVLVDPGVPIPLAVQRLCGIDDAAVRGAAAAEEAVARLAGFAQGAQLVAHSAAFDLAFCAAVDPGSFAGRPCVDTLELARIVLPAAPSHSLGELAASLALGHERPHRALSDADTTRALLLALLERVEALDPGVRDRVAARCRGRAWATGAVLAGEGPLPRGDGVATAAPAAPPARAAADAGPGRPAGGLLDPVAIAALLGPDGPLAGAGDGYELREGQQQMAMAVAQAFNRGGCLLVEAGTGVGKSLAYLVPAREWAARRSERVVVATHTIPLQEQLAKRDLPALERWRPLGVRSALLKGRGHYLSLRRFDRWLAATPSGGDERSDLERLRFQLRCLVWTAGTATGDRAELRLAGPEAALWDEVASTVGDCLGPSCDNWQARRCFMVRARLEAREAEVLVVSHALLLADIDSGGAILPPYRHLVVDEAHRLEEAATAGATVGIRAGDVLRVVDRLPPAGDAVELGAALQAARLHAVRAFGACKGVFAAVPEEDGGRGRVLGLTRSVRAGAGWALAARELERMAGACAAAARGLRGCDPVGFADPAGWPQPANAGPELAVAADALDAVSRDTRRVLAAASGPEAAEVAWLELEGGDRAALRLAPVSIGARLREEVFDRCDTVVLTSATLTVGGSFAYLRSRLQLPGAEELTLPSEYDYLRQALLCLPRPMPAPEDPRHTGVLVDLVVDVATRLGGRTLVLFTAFAALRAAHAALRPRLEAIGLVLLGQGLDGTRQQLLRNFRDNPTTVLLGSATFWEGVDVPGDALQCVVINKLPFPVPTDPLYQARTRGRRDAFREEALPQAVLRLRQGFGRLVRTTTDRGAVVLCDPRVLTRDYGAELLGALPRAATCVCPPEEVGAAIAGFLAGEGAAAP
ncbi:MAG TPA: helicase C-terminal domain-containing protein [Candidatus Micrarchaeia archaeon]|nr:helicase C-terminal domain-containing protein [Candidatus Micrarchaeia archaeon]